MPRRQKGMKGRGSVFQRQSDGRWVAQFIVEETGKPKQLYADTEVEAYKKLDNALREQEQGVLVTGPKQKLKDYLEHWLEDVHKPSVWISTYVRDRRAVYKHIIPALGNIELRKLTPQQVQKFYTALGKKTDKGEKGLAPGSIKIVHHVLGNALKNAVKWKLVAQNVCDQVSPPPAKKQEMELLTAEQMQRLIQVVNNHKMGPFIKLALMTGMRHGEMLALEWKDIDFDTNILQIRRNVNHLTGHGFVVGEPKTEDGKRKIVLPRFVVEDLKRHRERQNEQRKALREQWIDKDLIFCNYRGGYTRHDDSLERFRKVLAEAGLPTTMRLHDLRHNLATFLIHVMKYPPNLVQALLGHHDVTITLALYAHPDTETLREMMESLDRLFGGK